MVKREPRLHLMLAGKLDNVKNFPGSTDFDGMKGSWRAGEAWRWERPGETTDGCAASVEVDTLRM